MARGDREDARTAASGTAVAAQPEPDRAIKIEAALKNFVAEADQLQPMSSPKEDQIARLHKVADEARAALKP